MCLCCSVRPVVSCRLLFPIGTVFPGVLMRYSGLCRPSSRFSRSFGKPLAQRLRKTHHSILNYESHTKKIKKNRARVVRLSLMQVAITVVAQRAYMVNRAYLSHIWGNQNAECACGQPQRVSWHSLQDITAGCSAHTSHFPADTGDFTTRAGELASFDRLFELGVATTG